MKIEFKLRDSDARRWQYFLAKRYDAKSSTPLSKLVRHAALEAIQDEAQKEVRETELRPLAAMPEQCPFETSSRA